MRRFTPIPEDLLQATTTAHADLPTLYRHPNRVLRHFFWDRLHRLAHCIEHVQPNALRCLDFGCGSGVFLPTLATLFQEVHGLDHHGESAQTLIQAMGIPNAQVFCEDISAFTPPEGPYTAIVAADVLEHFEDLASPVQALSRWLAPGGHLFTSLPTENGLYVFLRQVFSVEKPHDHYHTAAQVEKYLAKQGFRAISRQSVPFNWGWTPLFQITAWQKEE